MGARSQSVARKELRAAVPKAFLGIALVPGGAIRTMNSVIMATVVAFVHGPESLNAYETPGLCSLPFFYLYDNQNSPTMKNSTLSDSFNKIAIRFLLSCFVILPGAGHVQAQCSNFDAQFPAATQTILVPNTWETITTCVYGGEWSACNVTNGITYSWTTCPDNSFDTQLTLWNTAHTVNYAYNDDDCGLQSTISWTATFTGVVHCLVSEFFCQSNTTCMQLDWMEAACTPPAVPFFDQGSSQTICQGDTTFITVTNFCGGCTYAWSNGDNGINIAISPSINTCYDVTVTDVNACTEVSGQHCVTVNPAPNANAGSDVAICTGGNTTLNASGGTSYSWSPTTGLSNPNISNPVASPSSTTAYCVTVTDGNGCTALDCVIVTVNTSPGTATVSGNQNPPAGNEVYTASATGATSYAWTVPGGWIIISGQGTPALTVSVGPTTGDICATPTNTCGNGSQGCLPDVVGMKDNIKFINDLSAFPNPSNGEFTISMKVTKPMDLMIRISNTIGQVIYREELNKFSGAFSKVISLPAVSSGIYTLSIVSEEGSLQRKVFITQ